MGNDFYVDPRKKREVVSTGIKSLDLLLNGGFRTGMWVELFGAPGCGKSFVALKTMAEAQKKWPEKYPVYLDFERVWDPDRAESLGVDLDRVFVLAPKTQEDGYQGVRDLAEGKSEHFPGGKKVEVSVFVIDSVAAMIPDYEAENEMQQQSVGRQASVHSKGLRYANPFLGDAIVLLINQIRENIGVMYGNPEKTSGGRALLHWASHRIRVSRLKIEKEDSESYDAESGGLKKSKVDAGFKMKFFLEKTRGGREHGSTELLYLYDEGDIPFVEDVKNVLASKKLITKAGAFFQVIGEEKKIQGVKKLNDWIEGNPEKVDALLKEALS